MKSVFSKIIWRTITIVLFISVLLMIWQYALGNWTFEDVMNYAVDVLRYLVPGIVILYVLFKLFGEKVIYFFGRRKSAEINIDEVPDSTQVSGPKRKGKDASQTGAAVIISEELRRRFKKELKILKQKLYIYDFRSINEFLDRNGEKLLVASDMRINKVFSHWLIRNECFILPYWIKKGISPNDHYRSWKYQKDKKVPDVPFIDGLTPGGKHMLSLLLRYFLVYMRLNYIPNFIMSNQPIIEDHDVSKDGKIKILFSKIFSQDFFKLREKTPMPFPIGGVVLETETAIFYPNTDKQIESYIKNASGIRETMTISGHLFKEEIILRGITQSKTRTNLSLRELYEGYIHVFGFKFVCTSNFTRFFYKLRRIIKLFRHFIIEIRINHGLIKPIKKRLQIRQYKIRKKISLLHQKDLKKWSKGYLVFNLGVYDNIEDCGKRVKQPLFYGIKDSSNKNSAYRMLGFRQVNKITDSFGRYDTWHMNSVREAKEKLIDLHFKDVPNWSGRKMQPTEMQYMNYELLDKMLAVQKDHEAEELKQKKIRTNKFNQYIKIPVLPDLIRLETKELLTLCKDFNIDNTFDVASDTYRADIIKALSIEYKSIRQKEK